MNPRMETLEDLLHAMDWHWFPGPEGRTCARCGGRLLLLNVTEPLEGRLRRIRMFAVCPDGHGTDGPLIEREGRNIRPTLAEIVRLETLIPEGEPDERPTRTWHDWFPDSQPAVCPLCGMEPPQPRWAWNGPEDWPADQPVSCPRHPGVAAPDLDKWNRLAERLLRLREPCPVCAEPVRVGFDMDGMLIIHCDCSTASGPRLHSTLRDYLDAVDKVQVRERERMERRAAMRTLTDAIRAWQENGTGSHP